VLFGLPFVLTPSTSCFIHIFTQSLSSFRNTCSYQRNLFCCSTEIMSSNYSLSQLFTWNSILFLNVTHLSDHSLPAEVPPHFLFSQARSHLHATYYYNTQLLHSLPLIINDISLLVRNGTNSKHFVRYIKL